MAAAAPYKDRWLSTGRKNGFMWKICMHYSSTYMFHMKYTHASTYISISFCRPNNGFMWRPPQHALLVYRDVSCMIYTSTYWLLASVFSRMHESTATCIPVVRLLTTDCNLQYGPPVQRVHSPHIGHLWTVYQQSINSMSIVSVSYTHLTLPTILRV